MTKIAMLMAITILLAIVPNIGIIQIGPVSLTILHIPVIIAGVLYEISGGLILGLTFGISSFFVASTRAVSPIDLLFVNPLISILPRVLFGLFVGGVSSFLKKKNKVSIGILSFISSLIHTFLVSIALYFFGKEVILSSDTSIKFFSYLASLISVNAILEAAVASFVTIVIFSRVKSIKHKIEE